MASIDSQREDFNEKKVPNITVTRSKDPTAIGPRVPVSNLISHWWQEFVACAIAVLTVLGLFGFLLYLQIFKDPPPLPSWLSLNAIVSVFTTVTKAAIIVVVASGIGQLKWLWFSKDGPKPLEHLSDYDSATRGSWGAAWLLWRLRKSDLLASFGALIIIFALGLEPLSQQIIKYIDCGVVYDDNPAKLNRTSRFEVAGVGVNNDNVSVPLPQDLQDLLRAAVLDPSPFGGYNCSSGNCTWAGNFSTLGWCSSCEDMSAKLEVTNSSESVGGSMLWNLTSTLPDSMLSVNWTASTQQLAAMSPSYLWETSSNVTYTDPTFIDIDFIVPRRPEGAVDPSTGKPWADCKNEPIDSDSWQCQGYGASRCSLTPCVKTYHGDVDDLFFYEEPLVNSSNWLVNPDSRSLTILDASASCIGTDEQNKLIALKLLDPASNLSVQWLPIDYLTLPSPPSPYSALNTTAFEACTYTLQHAFLNSVNRYFSTLLTGGIWTPGDTRQIQGQDAIKGLYNGGTVSLYDVDYLFSNISLALEYYIRDHGVAAFNLPELGDNIENGVCVEVRWGWLAFPSGLVLGTLVFFFAMVIRTWPRVGGPEIWKSSPLAYMFNVLTEDDEDDEDEEGKRHDRVDARRREVTGRKGSLAEQAGGRRDMRNLRRVARRTRVKLGKPARGLMETGLEYLTS